MGVQVESMRASGRFNNVLGVPLRKVEQMRYVWLERKIYAFPLSIFEPNNVTDVCVWGRPS